MKEVAEFAGEHLLIGNLGKLSVFISFAASLFSVCAYAFAVQNKEDESFWKKMGRLGFILHGLAVVSIFASLFFIIQQHYFEYQYAYQHSSMELPLRYMISCFWEGQEGSFLLWMTWHVVLGTVLMFRSKTWEAPVMAIIALSQVMLSTMLLGIEIGGWKIGSSPFILLREVQPDIFNLPFIQIRGAANYLSAIQDGNGLNPLLQNYWMVIHPPTLFLGFAAAIVPFAYAIAGLWTRRVNEWGKPALPWTLFGVMVLGTGIIMGAFWAYESLTFGGYWAWDPVENASLIPWLLLIALSHTLIIWKKTGKALYISFILAIFSFLLVLYATFLTRSGVLGDTSVHSFTDLGMSGQLLLFFFLFVAVPTLFAFHNDWKKWTFIGMAILAIVTASWIGYIEWLHLPLLLMGLAAIFYSVYQVVPRVSQADEELSSREFWMFIGALVFVLACFFIVIHTSIPVWNKLFPWLKKAPPADIVAYYNGWMMPMAIIIGALVGFGQLFKFKKTSDSFYKRHFTIVMLASFGTTILLALLFGTQNPWMIAFLFAGVFAVIGNTYYWIRVLKFGITFSGASVSHIGFGLMLIGIMSSGSGKKVVSLNQSGINLGENFDDKANRENVLLWRNVPTLMGDYEVTYEGDTTVSPDTYYRVRFKGFDRESGTFTGDEFVLQPNAQINPKMGLVSNPDTRHYLTHDVFTHVTQVPDKESTRKAPFEHFRTHEMKMGDTIVLENGIAILTLVTPDADKATYNLQNAEHMLVAELKVLTFRDTLYAHPVFALSGDQSISLPDEMHDIGIRFKLTDINVNTEDYSKNAFVIETAEKPPVQDFIILKAMVFPYINLLWGGTIIMVVGFLIAIAEKLKRKK